MFIPLHMTSEEETLLERTRHVTHGTAGKKKKISKKIFRKICTTFFYPFLFGAFLPLFESIVRIVSNIVTVI